MLWIYHVQSPAYLRSKISPTCETVIFHSRQAPSLNWTSHPFFHPSNQKTPEPLSENLTICRVSPLWFKQTCTGLLQCRGWTAVSFWGNFSFSFSFCSKIPIAAFPVQVPNGTSPEDLLAYCQSRAHMFGISFPFLFLCSL